MVPLHVQLENSTLRRVIKRLHFPLEVMLLCVRWYAAYPLSLRNLEEMMAERGVQVDHATVHRWALKMLPVLAAVFRLRKLPVDSSWRVDETYVLVGGQWKYLYRAVDKLGLTVDFLLIAHRDVAAARRFFERAINLHDLPEKITIPSGLAQLTGRKPTTTLAWADAVRMFLDWMAPRIKEYHTLLTRNAIFVKRTAGIVRRFNRPFSAGVRLTRR